MVTSISSVDVDEMEEEEGCKKHVRVAGDIHMINKGSGWWW